MTISTTAYGGAVLALATAMSLPVSDGAAGHGADEPTVATVLDEYADALRPPGVALVTVHEGRTTFHVRGIDGAGDPVTPDTPFRIASMSKAFTALAVMQQVDAGRLDVDDRVTDVLPELRLSDDRFDSVTVRHLLTHTSGLSATALEYTADAASSATDFVALLADERLTAPPGLRDEYSNAGYKVLARVVEVTSGRELNDYLAGEVFEPLGMTSTTVTDRCDARPPGLTNGYVTVLRARAAVPELPISCVGDGGVVSTATDMAVWLRFQLGDGASPATGERVVSQASLAAMHDVPGELDAHAFGWYATTMSADGAPFIGHGGNLATFSSSIELSPITGTGAVALTNAAGVPGTLTHNAITALDGGPHQPPSTFLDTLNLVLASLCALVLLLCGLVMWRSGQWAARRRTGSWWSIALRLTPLALVASLGAVLPLMVGASVGLTGPVAYQLIAWMLPLAAVLALTMLVGGGAALGLRLVRLRDRRRLLAPTAGATR